jgi:hypothetical protein
MSALGPRGHIPQGPIPSPPKSLQPPHASGSRQSRVAPFPAAQPIPARRVMRSAPHQLGKGGMNAKGRPIPGGQPNDPHRTGATDPRYGRSRAIQRAVDDVVHSQVLGQLRGIGEDMT